MALAEPGQVAPVLSLRNIAANENVWEIGISGWTASMSVERPMNRSLVFVGSVAATPYNANSSLRAYRDGRREGDLEYDAASYTARGGVRIRQSERSTTEVQLLVGRDVIGSDAPDMLRNDWDAPYAGVIGSQRYRRVTASDPFTSRIDGLEVLARAEIYGGGHLWSRLMLTETAGSSFGRIHVQQSVMIVAGSNLDRVSSFLVGGSWDVLGPQAIYGRRYAEYRVTRGVVANVAVDHPLGTRWNVGGRVSAFRGPGVTTYGSALQASTRLRGFRLTIGAAAPFSGDGEHPKMIYASVSTAVFR